MRNAAGPANREIVVAKGGAKPGVSAAEGIGDSTLVPLRLVRTTGIAAQPEAAPGAGVEERGARSSSGRGAFTGLGVLSLTGPTSPLTDDEMADLAFTSIQMLTGGDPQRTLQIIRRVGENLVSSPSERLSLPFPPISNQLDCAATYNYVTTAINRATSQIENEKVHWDALYQAAKEACRVARIPNPFRGSYPPEALYLYDRAQDGKFCRCPDNRLHMMRNTCLLTDHHEYSPRLKKGAAHSDSGHFTSSEYNIRREGPRLAYFYCLFGEAIKPEHIKEGTRASVDLQEQPGRALHAAIARLEDMYANGVVADYVRALRAQPCAFPGMG